MNFELREHQTKAIEQLRAALATTRRVMMQAPTGSGKTMIASSIVESAREKGKRVLFTVPAISLIDQTVEMFFAQGIRDIGVIQANHEMTDWSRPVQIASVQTLMRRAENKDDPNNLRLPDADVTLVDEAHRWFSFYAKWFCNPAWEHKPIIGLSATPWTRGLGAYYDELVTPVTTAELIEKGLLSPFKVFAPQVHVDMKGVRSQQTDYGPDYVQGEAAERMSRPEIIADVIDTWLKRAERRPTLLFAVNCQHARTLQERFTAAGVKAGYQDARTSDEERKSIKRAFHNGDLEVVCNVGTLTTGVDWDCRCISLCRPTRSEMLFVQIIGRGLRTAEGKDYCLILDHSDNHLRLGFVDEIDAGHSGQGLHNGTSAPPAGDQGRVALPKECPSCGFIMKPRCYECPNCHYVKGPSTSPIKEQDGELTELATRKVKAPPVAGEKDDVYAQLLGFAKQKGYQRGWAAHKYREIFDVWPHNGLKWTAPKKPDEGLEAWIASQQFKWARKRRREAAMTERERQIIAEVAKQHPQYTPGTLMTKEDWQEDFR